MPQLAQHHRADRRPILSVVIPVKNEAENIGPVKAGILAHIESHQMMVVAHSFADQTPKDAVALGGVALQLRTGFGLAQGDAILVTMADRCDDPRDIPAMLAAFEAGADMVCASRYMPDGRQIGAPRVKSFLSWLAGWLLYKLGLPTHDPSNSYKLYRADKLRALDLTSARGFDINLEIMAKALAAGWNIVEIPTTWVERRQGASNFRLIRWLPYYLRWFMAIAWHLTMVFESE